ncbi:hypothetical protein F0562_007263 [Nyssa sinensis]|uniref:Uncharacterized protein n=1 Tax=Nyssa sinensis TaxID=561372 RepID=A0A5J5A5Z6_9ASTE|nr:hypothetical protein F0562_007263 [Nyssa sinensis]
MPSTEAAVSGSQEAHVDKGSARPDVVQETGSAGKVAIVKDFERWSKGGGEDYARDSYFLHRYTNSYCATSIKARRESPFPIVEDDGQTTRQEKVLNEAVNVGDAQEVANTESVDVPREVAEKARRNIVPSQSVSCEHAGAANNVLDPP